MISFPDIETINKHCARLKEIIYKNKRDIDNAIYTKRKLEFVKWLRENLVEAEEVLKRYEVLKKKLKYLVLHLSK